MNPVSTVLVSWSLAVGIARADEGCAAGGSLEVLSVNAWGLPPPLARDRRGRLPGVASFVRAADVDVVGLQEVWRGAVPLLPLDGVALPSEGGDSGLGLRTRHAAAPLEHHTYGRAWGWDALKRKGWIASAVDVPGWGEVTVAVTHLQAGPSGPAAVARRAQVAELLTWARAVPGPLLLMGDFNLHHDHSDDAVTQAHLLAAGFVDVADALGAVEGTYPGTPHRLDRVYVRDGGGRCLVPDAVEVRGWGEEALSDHAPVWARLGVGRTVGGGPVAGPTDVAAE